MKKALNIIKNIFVWLMVALAVCMMIFTIISVNTFDRSDLSLFGFKAFIVLSDSMSKTDFDAGDLVLVKEVDPSTLKEGTSLPTPRRIPRTTARRSPIKSEVSPPTRTENRALSPTVLRQIPTTRPWLHILMFWVNTKPISRRSANSLCF